MQSHEIRSKFLKFFEKRGHAIIPSASLVPENDPSVLFNTAGMQPLVPFLMGAKHPLGKRLANVQKCVRTGDIDDIGDNRHLTFFEMLGNWSLGDYFKEDAIKWSYELLTSEEEGFGLDPKRLYVTVFAGDSNAPRDDEAARIWESVGVPKHRIYYKDASANWWPAVKGKDTWTGPTGPCSEMFYDITEKGLGDLSPTEYDVADESGQVIEIWNDVFMEFEKKEGKIVSKLNQKNVDTGAGFERICTVLQGKDNVFETDLFAPIMAIAKSFSSNLQDQRIISDHIRTATFMIADGVVPANTDQGYILRRIIRRMVYKMGKQKFTKDSIETFVDILTRNYGATYQNIVNQKSKIIDEIVKEADKFHRTLENGVKELTKLLNSKQTIDGNDAFDLYQSFGLPLELTREIASKIREMINKDVSDLNKMQVITNEEFFFDRMKAHQDLSRQGAEKKFKGGLGDTSEQSVRYHTATHLLNAALRSVLGNHVGQKGSNITAERLRFDFSHHQKMTPEEIKRVEAMVNEKIQEALPVSFQEMRKEDAEKLGALHAFGEKYADVVKVYTIGDEKTEIFSREFCGGPHVKNTSELGTFKIQKEEAVSAGVRRIKAVLQ